jgi:hypothetical protein
MSLRDLAIMTGVRLVWAANGVMSKALAGVALVGVLVVALRSEPLAAPLALLRSGRP